MAWLLWLSLANAGNYQPLVQPSPTVHQLQAPLTVDAPVLRAEEAPETPPPGQGPDRKTRKLIIGLSLTFAALTAVAGTVICCCCFGIYGYY